MPRKSDVPRQVPDPDDALARRDPLAAADSSPLSPGSSMHVGPRVRHDVRATPADRPSPTDRRARREPSAPRDWPRPTRGVEHRADAGAVPTTPTASKPWPVAVALEVHAEQHVARLGRQEVMARRRRAAPSSTRRRTPRPGPIATSQTLAGSSSRNGVLPPTICSTPLGVDSADWRVGATGRLRCMCSSALDQPRVRAVDAPVSSLVRAALHDLAALQHDDLVAVADRAEPVRDDEAGAAAAAQVIVDRSSRSSASSALVASSSTRMVGLATSARAISRRWRWPPLKLRPPSSTGLS